MGKGKATLEKMSKEAKAVFFLMLSDPGKDFSDIELMKETGLTREQFAKGLEDLAAMNLIEVTDETNHAHEIIQ